MALPTLATNRTALAVVVAGTLAVVAAALAPGVLAEPQSGDELDVLAANGSVDDRIDGAADVRPMAENGDASGTATTISGEADLSTPDRTATTTSGGGPGFGVTAAPVAVLLALAAVARRR